MTAEVVIINNGNAMLAARSNPEEYIIFEILERQDIEIGDIISSLNTFSLGSENFYNNSKQRNIRLFLQNVCGSLEQAQNECAMLIM